MASEMTSDELCAKAGRFLIILGGVYVGATVLFAMSTMGRKAPISAGHSPAYVMTVSTLVISVIAGTALIYVWTGMLIKRGSRRASGVAAIVSLGNVIGIGILLLAVSVTSFRNKETNFAALIVSGGLYAAIGALNGFAGWRVFNVWKILDREGSAGDALGMGSKVIIGGTALVLICFGGLFVRQMRLRTSRPAGAFNIVMHDPSMLESKRLVEWSTHCSILFPRTFQQSEVMGGLIAKSSNAAIMVRIVDLPMDFDSYVAKQRGESRLFDIEFQESKIEAEGAVSLGDLDGYLITREGRAGGRPIRYRTIYLKGSNSKCYMLVTLAPVEEWDANVDAFDSSLSTFEGK